METVIQSVEKMIKSQFENEGTGHDWYHIDRVRRVALQIQKNEGGDRLVIELAALLHDVSDHKFNGGDFEVGRSEEHTSELQSRPHLVCRLLLEKKKKKKKTITST